jgi:hypothetical protein
MQIVCNENGMQVTVEAKRNKLKIYYEAPAGVTQIIECSRGNLEKYLNAIFQREKYTIIDVPETFEDKLLRRATEIWKLGGNMTKLDIIRHLKEVQRDTAKHCTEMIKERTEYLYADKLFADKYKDEAGEGREPTASEFADEVIRSILNTFLS